MATEKKFKVLMRLLSEKDRLDICQELGITLNTFNTTFYSHNGTMKAIPPAIRKAREILDEYEKEIEQLESEYPKASNNQSNQFLTSLSQRNQTR